MTFTEMITRFQLIPLISFALLSRMLGQDNKAYFFAFNIGAILAMAQMASIYVQEIMIDRMALGANLFLIGGSIGVILFKLGFPQLITLYGSYTFAMFFFGLILAGLITTLFTKAGYVGIESESKEAVTYYSWMLLLCTIFPTVILISIKWINPMLYQKVGLYLVMIFFITLNYVRDYIAQLAMLI